MQRRSREEYAALAKLQRTRTMDLIAGVVLVYLADSSQTYQGLWTILAGVFLFLAAFNEILFLRLKNRDPSQAHPLLILPVLLMVVLLIVIPLFTATAAVRYYKAENGISYAVKKDTGVVQKVYGGEKTVVLADSYKDVPVTVIGRMALSMRKSMEEIDFPDQLKEIGFGAFHYCKGLQEVTLPDGLEIIGKNAFTGCSNLHRVTIPASVGEIPASAFNGCPKDMVIVGEPGSAAQTYAEKYFSFEPLTP